MKNLALAQFSWNSLQVNEDTQAFAHRDSQVTGLSVITLMGTFTGGAFTLEGQECLTSRGRAMMFDSKKPHWVGPFTGKRYSIVYFSREWHPPEDDTRHYLASLGFRPNGIEW